MASLLSHASVLSFHSVSATMGLQTGALVLHGSQQLSLNRAYLRSSAQPYHFMPLAYTTLGLEIPIGGIEFGVLQIPMKSRSILLTTPDNLAGHEVRTRLSGHLFSLMVYDYLTLSPSLRLRTGIGVTYQNLTIEYSYKNRDWFNLAARAKETVVPQLGVGFDWFLNEKTALKVLVNWQQTSRIRVILTDEENHSNRYNSCVFRDGYGLMIGVMKRF